MWRTRAAHLIATVGGTGHLPFAPGTAGSFVGLAAGYVMVQHLAPIARWGLLGAGFVLAVTASTETERRLGTVDPPTIVIDEAWAMAAIVSLLPWLVHSWAWLVTAFGLFRLFDITKPPPARALSRLPGGWGIVADDCVAALYAGTALALLRLVL